MWTSYGNKKKKKPQDPAKQIEKLRKKDAEIQPVLINGKLGKTWWGNAWNKNLESYADYSNRIGRGRSYVKSGAVLDLKITSGEVQALVQGSRAKPYQIHITIAPLPEVKWNNIVSRCSNSIGSLEELVSGRFPRDFIELFVSKENGLFPSPKEINFSCSCPDWAYMCKHVAAALYGIGARFDNDPTLFFLLRNIEFSDLIKKSINEKMQSMLQNADRITDRVIKNADTVRIFGV